MAHSSRFLRFLLVSTSALALSFPALAQSVDAALQSAYAAYLTAQESGDQNQIAAAEAALKVECDRLGFPNIKACIAALKSDMARDKTAAPPANEAAPPADQAPPPADQSSPPADQADPAPAPAPADQQAAPAPAPADQQPAPADQAPANPAQDPALVAAYQAYVAAQSSGDAKAIADAEKALRAECRRVGLPDLKECLALFGAEPAPGASEQAPGQDVKEAAPGQQTEPANEAAPGQQPVPANEAAPGQQAEPVTGADAPDAPVAPVLDSAKEGAAAGQAAPATDTQASAPAAPSSDAEAQANVQVAPADVTAVIEATGKEIKAPPPVTAPAAANVVQTTDDNRFILKVDVNLTIYRPYDDRDRLALGGDSVMYEELDNGRVRQVVIRADGTRVITVWDRNGEVIRRIKVLPDGTRVILIYASDTEGDFWESGVRDLPPFRLTIPVSEYVLYADRSDENDIELFLSEPPLERFDRVYSVEEVKHTARLRDTVRRVEIGDLTFATGSAKVDRSQVGSLDKVAKAIKGLIARNPAEIFLVEGHTDAVGSDESNLVLSDRRAEAVARLLTDVYGIPPENLATQGYGERYLKVETEGPERANRRVTIRRITALVQPRG